jgi:prevent-host-death family protein
MQEIAFSELPASLQDLFNQVQQTGNPITVTQDGTPVVTIYPVQTSKRAPFGVVKDSGQIVGDLVEPPLSPTVWNVLQ